MLLFRLVFFAALAALLSGCAAEGNGLDTSLGGGLGLGGISASSQPNTDAYVKQQLERRGI